MTRSSEARSASQGSLTHTLAGAAGFMIDKGILSMIRANPSTDRSPKRGGERSSSFPSRVRKGAGGVVLLCVIFVAPFLSAQSPEGVRAVGADGRALNLDFETGDLR